MSEISGENNLVSAPSSRDPSIIERDLLSSKFTIGANGGLLGLLTYAGVLKIVPNLTDALQSEDMGLAIEQSVFSGAIVGVAAISILKIKKNITKFKQAKTNQEFNAMIEGMRDLQ